MNKIFFWLILFGVGMLVWKFWQIAQVKNARREARNANTSAANRLPASEVMVRCAQCGLYLPESDAFKRGDDVYCSPAHRDLPRPN